MRLKNTVKSLYVLSSNSSSIYIKPLWLHSNARAAASYKWEASKIIIIGLSADLLNRWHGLRERSVSFTWHTWMPEKMWSDTVPSQTLLCGSPQSKRRKDFRDIHLQFAPLLRRVKMSIQRCSKSSSWQVSHPLHGPSLICMTSSILLLAYINTDQAQVSHCMSATCVSLDHIFI